MFSFVTIIGWAWVYVAFIQWVCKHIYGGDNELEFHGTGGEMLWRGILAMLASFFIIPIPWVMVWLTKWFADNLVVRQEVSA
jgi:uncharacterized membrane protein YjgN (DUF898 family)